MPKTKKRKYNFKKYKSGDPNDPSNPFGLSLNMEDINEEDELLSTKIDERWIEEKSKNGELEVFRDYNEKLHLLSNTNFYIYDILPPKKERFESFLQDYIDDHIFIKVPYNETADPQDFYVYAYHIEDCNKSKKKGNNDYVCDGQPHPSHHLAELKNKLNPYSKDNRKKTAYTLKNRMRNNSPASVFDIVNDPPDITGVKRPLSPNSIEGGKKRKRRKTLKRKKRKSMKRKNKK